MRASKRCSLQKISQNLVRHGIAKDLQEITVHKEDIGRSLAKWCSQMVYQAGC
ncbi:hypothetical protein E2C01_037316 [Portunus trituberculatus]|uniref:Uncharacterized protein n=1 Tax=Portunus trituberculatus TaxID=210409 RepID=A0A5B7FGR2_PORTR|nr:hypothetical protein [Portunus trituberculatus]